MPRPQIHFVVSSARSGSTWLVDAINGHPEIFATEQRLFGRFFQLWPNDKGRLAPRITLDAYARAFSVHYFHQQFSGSRDEFIDQFTAEMIDFLADFAARKTGAKVLVDKITPYPGTSRIVLQQIERFCPQSKLIQLVRDGRDVATSGTFDWLLKNAEGTDRHEFYVVQNPSVQMDRFFDDLVLRSWAEQWVEATCMLNRTEPVITVRYEEMLGNQAAALRRIFALLGVDDSAEVAAVCAQQAAFDQVTGRQPGDERPTEKRRSGIAGGWKRFFTRQDGELFHEIAGETLIREGYESNTDWIASLPEKLPPQSVERTAGAETE